MLRMKTRDLHMLLGCQFLGLVGDRVTTLCMVTLVSLMAPASVKGSAASLIAAIQVAALLIFSYVGGMMADRISKRTLLMGVALSRATVIGLLSLVFFSWLRYEAIFLIVLILGLLSGVFNPARRSFLPFLVSPTELPFANRLMAGFDIMAMLLGIAVGILLLKLYSTQTALLVDSTAFLLSALFIGKINNPGNALLTSTTQSKPLSILSSVKEGGSYLLRTPKPRAVLWRVSLPFSLAAGFFYSGTNFWATATSPENAGVALGTVLLPLCIGALSCFVIIRYYHTNNHWKGVMTAYAFCIPFMMALSLPGETTIWRVAALMLPIGLSVGALYYYSILLLHQTVDKEHMGRIMGIYELFASGGFVVAVVLSSLILPGFDASAGWMLSASCFLLGLIFSSAATKMPSLTIMG